MSLTSTFAALVETFRDDALLADLGARRGELMRLHYGGRWAARSGNPPRPRTLWFRHLGRPVEVRLSAPYLGAFKGIFFDREYDCQGLFKTPPQRILDLGANIGMGAISLSCQFPEAEFVCVEPDPRNLDLLKTNLDQNGIQAEIMPAAVAVAPGKSSLRFNQNPTCSRLESLPEQDLHELTGVDLVTVPEIIERLGWGTIDLVKIDIEGAEDEILSSNQEWLGKVGAIILEIHPITTPEKIFSYIKDFGFSLRRHGNGREPVYFCERR